jgi:hypothetical protein
MIRKLKDWSGWWDGLRSKSFKAGAEAISTNVTAMLGTNGVASMGIPGLTDIGLGWKTAVATTLIQFSLRVVAAAAQYVKDRPDPDVITETVETAHFSKSADGSVESGGSKKTTTTPVTKEE